MTSQTLHTHKDFFSNSESTLFSAHSPEEALAFKASGLPLTDARLKTFFLNGRFLAQSMTGVQRYAHEVISEINVQISNKYVDATLCLPANVPSFKTNNFARFRKSHFASGYLWEQAILPFLVKGPLLNLCNLAPVLLKKQIVCIHDANVFIAPQSYSRNFRAFYTRILPFIAKRSQIITTVSKFSATQISKHFNISSGKIFVLPNGHEHVLRWNARRSPLFSQVSNFRPYVLLLGSRAAHKNMSLIFDLAERLNEIGLDIRVTGNTSNIFASASTHTYSNQKNIIFMGHVNDDDLAVLFSNALCLAFPSLTEGFGIPILEAMALGCPVVSSNAASMPEVCGDAALLAPPEDSELWFKHIRNFYTSNTLRHQCIEKGHEQIKQFSWKKTAAQYLDLIHQNFE